MIMSLEGLSGQEILEVELATGVPIVYKLDGEGKVLSKEVLSHGQFSLLVPGVKSGADELCTCSQVKRSWEVDVQHVQLEHLTRTPILRAHWRCSIDVTIDVRLWRWERCWLSRTLWVMRAMRARWGLGEMSRCSTRSCGCLAAIKDTALVRTKRSRTAKPVTATRSCVLELCRASLFAG